MNLRHVIYLKPAFIADGLSAALSTAGWRVHAADGCAPADALRRRYRPSVGLIHLAGDESWRRFLASDWLPVARDIKWIAILDRDTPLDDETGRLVSEWCFDYHTMPLQPERLSVLLGHAHGMARIAAAGETPSRRRASDTRILGNSPVIRQLNRDIRKLGTTDVPVLVTGESGTGKELVARGIHEQSVRRRASFVAVNCGALPSELIHSELFGHERGAFTGAASRRIGRIEAAHRGTLFLDEVGDLPLEQQVSLLRFLQESTIQRLGGGEEILVDVRVIAATNIDLDRAMDQGRFREDLYYRLNVVSLSTPPLREHPEDIELLAEFFLERFAVGERKTFTRPALQAMVAHEWPGNVRELVNRVRRAIVMSDGRTLEPAHLCLERAEELPRLVSLQDAKAQAEKAVVESTLLYAGNNLSEAARQLGVSRVTLYALLKKYGLAGEPVAVAS